MRRLLALSLLAAVAASTAAEARAQSRFGDRGRLKIGASVGFSHHWDFEDVVAEQPGILEAEADELPLNVRGFAEYEVVERWHVGVGVQFQQHDVRQTYQTSDPRLPSAVSGTVDGTFWDLYVGRRLGGDSLDWRVDFGLTWAENEYTLRSDYLGSFETTTRTHTGWKGRIGTNVGVPLFDPVQLRLAADLVHALEGGDADAHSRISAGLAIQF